MSPGSALIVPADSFCTVIKHPMDLGTMTKKLKAMQYKSKQEFTHDLNLIWNNCTRYNASPEHQLRKSAIYLAHKTGQLVPLIPEIVIRDRAEVEAEERRLQNGDADLDGAEESDDEPIISSRGRIAPGKTAKKGASARKAPAGATESPPAAEVKLPVASSSVNGLGANLKNDALRADSESLFEGSHLSTPPPGSSTPAGANGVLLPGAPGSQPDAMDVDGIDSSLHASGLAARGRSEDIEHEDLEYKTWKQVTKKDRAHVTAERQRLFRNTELNVDEPALLRSKWGMRRWLRKQKEALTDGAVGNALIATEMVEGEAAGFSRETLAEGMEGEEERILPDYYDPLSAIPDLEPRLGWLEDSEGHVQDTSTEFLRILPPGLFTAARSSLTKRFDDNMGQMQATRKICNKIGIVKQMQVQSQVRVLPDFDRR